jgi:hypothetical protein
MLRQVEARGGQGRDTADSSQLAMLAQLSGVAHDWSWRYAAAADRGTLQGWFRSFAVSAGGGGAGTRSPPAKKAQARNGRTPSTQLQIFKPGLGYSSPRAVELKNENWAKLCRDCGLVEACWAAGAGVPSPSASAEIDLVFASHISPGRRGLTFVQFENALESLARRSLLQAATPGRRHVVVSDAEVEVQAKFRWASAPPQVTHCICMTYLTGKRSL